MVVISLSLSHSLTFSLTLSPTHSLTHSLTAGTSLATFFAACRRSFCACPRRSKKAGSCPIGSIMGRKLLAVVVAVPE